MKGRRDGKKAFLEKSLVLYFSEYLLSKGYISSSETVKSAVEIKNCDLPTYQIITSSSDLLIKQVDAGRNPQDQLGLLKAEAAFCQLIENYEYLSRFMPLFRGYDEGEKILIYDSIEDGKNLSTLYNNRIIEHEEIQLLTKWLSLLHRLRFEKNIRGQFDTSNNKIFSGLFKQEIPAAILENDAAYSGEMILLYEEINKDENVLKRIDALSSIYAQESETLIHGNFTPSNWFRSDSGVAIANPCFARFGSPEFDLGLFIAHLKLAQVAQEKIDIVLDSYENRDDINLTLMNHFVALEILYWQFYGRKQFVSGNLKMSKSLVEHAWELLVNDH